MKIFSWMRNKRNGKEGSNKPKPDFISNNMMHHPPCKEEFSDWPKGLLAIGTFGNNNNLKHSEKFTIQGTLPSDHVQDYLQTTTEQDFEEVDKELRLLLKISLDSSENHNLSVEKFLDFLSENEKKTTNVVENKDTHNQRTTTTSVVHVGGKDMHSSDNKKRGIGKRSLSFLLKKAFLCRGGFVPAPILKDPLIIPDPKLDNSRLEKILRAMLHKKIYPQRPTTKTTSKRYLDMAEEYSDEEEEYEEGNHKSKWVKTDSEYIVLEI